MRVTVLQHEVVESKAITLGAFGGLGFNDRLLLERAEEH
jgi:hypothetical protein